MADGPVRQRAWNAVPRGTSTVMVAFDEPTRPLATVVVVAVTTHSGSKPATFIGPAGFGPAVTSRVANELSLAVWRLAGAPDMSSLHVAVRDGRSLQVEALELAEVAQANSLDKVTIRAVARSSDAPTTGSTGTLAQADEVVVGFIANRYPSTRQLSFTGGLTPLSDRVTPSQDSDDLRSRLTVHTTVTAATAAMTLSGRLTSKRDWIAVLLTFKGATVGPARLTSRTGVAFETVGLARLTAGGQLRTGEPQPALSTTVVRARIAPCDYQYRLAGYPGLLIGEGTDYDVRSVTGLEGWEIRSADTDHPTGDGAHRGVDQQSAREVMFDLDVAGSEIEVENRLAVLGRVLVPQRTEDWPLEWRHPGQPLRRLWCRPAAMPRGVDWQQVLLQRQKFVLRAADPRLYGVVERRVDVPVSPEQVTVLTPMANLGSGRAYPVIWVEGPTSGDPVSRVELTNHTTGVAWVVSAVLPSRSVLRGDMTARVTGNAPRPILTINGAPKYNTWVLPRRTWWLNPGVNEVSLRVLPEAAPVACTVVYHDTWPG